MLYSQYTYKTQIMTLVSDHIYMYVNTYNFVFRITLYNTSVMID
jgi:hypothetical protein